MNELPKIPCAVKVPSNPVKFGGGTLIASDPTMKDHPDVPSSPGRGRH